MCVNFITVSRQSVFDWFRTSVDAEASWRQEMYCDYKGLFIVHDEHGQRAGKVGTYGFVPQRHRPFKKPTKVEQAKIDLAVAAGKSPLKPKRIRMDTMNTRAEEVGSKVTYKRFWLAQQLCIVPAMSVFEPNWETGRHERWALELASKEPFGMPGMWRTWQEDDGSTTNTFTHFTLNADGHPLLSRFHRPGEEKRGVAILRPEHYDDWLSSTNPEFARALIELCRPEELHAYLAPKPKSVGPSEAEEINQEDTQARSASKEPSQSSLFSKTT